ncbi:MAG TPA: methyltransferase domain-containing protein, partial [Planctomycetes bacterium]|nr:methyltransferase domain-containing protein [Planctomycetota bacterium]
EELFDRLAGQWDKFAGAFSTGRARERAASHLLPRPFTVADLGCGAGTMAEALLACTSHLILVDRSEAMLAEARTRLERRASGCRLDFRRGTLDDLPIEDAELDGCVAGMVLHHVPNLDPVLREMHRVLRPGGTASILELAPHHETWMRAELGDLHLGLPAEDVLAAMDRAGFEDLVLDPVEDQYCPRRAPRSETSAPAGADDARVSLSLYLVRGRRPRATP